MDKVSDLLPTTIEKSLDEPPLSVLIQIVDPRNIEAFLAIELTKLQSLVNVDERLNLQPHQIPFIASQLIELYKTETLADFKICFQRGALGRYDDKLLHLDAAVIGNWMNKYLDEKYQVAENKLMAEKENFYWVKKTTREADKPNPERNLLALFKAVVGEQKIEDDQKKVNEYEFYKARRKLQAAIYKEAAKLYPMEDLSVLPNYEDDQGLMIPAKSEEDAETIYKEAKKL